MKKSSKRLSHIFIRELVAVRNILEDIGEIGELDAIDPRLVFLYMDVDNLLVWADLNFNLNKESENFYEYEEYIDFMKYNGPLCYDCQTEDMDYYMVSDEIWAAHGAGEYQLCVPCLEKRVGKRLELTDFTDCLANEECVYVQDLKKASGG
jgi:hypothetical protein